MVNGGPTQVHEIECTYVRHTDNAICIKSDRDKVVWLPFSKIECAAELESLDEGDEIVVHVPDWLAMNEGLV